MKICFLTAWPLGLQGTPGTYLFLQKIVNYVDALIVSPRNKKNSVYTPNNALPWMPVKDLCDQSELKKILPILSHYDPDIFYIFNFPDWPIVTTYLKSMFRDKKFIIDIKTPLLSEGDVRKRIQNNCLKAEKNVDAIVALSSESVQTWIPGCQKQVLEYPLGIDITFFPDPITFYERSKIKEFVYIGSLHPKRKIDKLIECFQYTFDKHSVKAQLDLYGRGADMDKLEKVASSSRSYGYVCFKGLLDQQELIKKLPSYDAGVAWVPEEKYSHSPSLKAIEFLASGLPLIASNTIAHRHLADKTDIFLFDNNPESFERSIKEIKSWNDNDNLQCLKNNRKVVEQLDYEVIIEKYFIPLFNNLNSSLNKNEINIFSKSNNANIERLNKSKIVSNQSLNTSLKIVICCNSLSEGKGGAERVAMDTAIGMGKRGHLVYMAYADKGMPAYQRKKGVVLLPYDSLNSLSDYIHQIDPDVFFVFYFNRMLIDFYKIIHKTGIPFGMQECTNPQRLITNNWGRGQKYNIPHGLHSWEREMIASAASRIRLTMPLYANSFPSYIKPNIRTFSNPAFPQSKLADLSNKNGDKKVIINVGGIKANKNLITLLRAFETLTQDFPDWVLKVFGKTAEGKQPHKLEIREFIKQKNLQDKVIICGPTDNIFSEFASSQFHVISSLSEGCPTCVLEAMATGVPSIGFADCSGTNELINDRKNGILASPNDRVQNLSLSMRELMESEELRIELGSQALKDSKSFAPNTIYDQWESLFFEAAEYKRDSDRLFQEQMEIDSERAMHAMRMRDVIVNY